MSGVFDYMRHVILKYDIIHSAILLTLGEILKCLLKCLIIVQSLNINFTRNWFLQRRVLLHIMICCVATLCSFGGTDMSVFREEVGAVVCVRAMWEDMSARRGLGFLPRSVGPPLVINLLASELFFF